MQDYYYAGGIELNFGVEIMPSESYVVKLVTAGKAGLEALPFFYSEAKPKPASQPLPAFNLSKIFGFSSQGNRELASELR